MTAAAVLLPTVALLCVGMTSATPGSDEYMKWRPASGAVSEYSRYSRSEVRVFRGDQRITSTENGAGSHYAAITVEVTAFHQTFVLRLIKNRYLFAASYVERVITDAGPSYRQTNDMNANNCFYIGAVEGHPGSSASACTCYGFLGEFTVANETYSVEPTGTTLTGPHRAYRESDSVKTSRTCGHNATTAQLIDSVREARNLKAKGGLRPPQDLDGQIRFVELYVVNDFSQFQHMRSDVSTTVNRAKTLVNGMSALYHQQSIYVVLVGIEVWTAGDNITSFDQGASPTLTDFCLYRQNHINPRHHNDNAQLLTNRRPSGYIGYAWLQRMCNYGYSCAWTTDYYTMPAASSAIMAHEMGHNLGFLHDNELEQNPNVTCTCDDPSPYCIMDYAIRSNPPPTRWSQCSKDRLQRTFDDDMDYCLHNIPQTVYDDTPDCGNGIVDQGEDCDCGNVPTSQCNRGCCVNCRLTANATCAYGRCCNVPTCQLKPAYTECRSANGECDLAEYCNGTDPLCPSDVYRRNTDSCIVNGVSAYCYNGKCRSRQSQCRLWFGSSASNAIDACYTTYNVHGVGGGNCGYNYATQAYIRCSASNALCGSIQCNTDAVNSLQLVNFKTDWTRSYRYRRVGRVVCTQADYLSFYNGLNRTDAYLVPNGASCGTGKMCLNQRCVDVSSVGAAHCGNCSMRGVCNSLGQCHCEDGYAPPDCSKPGGGGSYHSNPISPYTPPTRMSTQTTTTTATVRETMKSTMKSTATVRKTEPTMKPTATGMSTQTTTTTATEMSTQTTTTTATVRGTQATMKTTATVRETEATMKSTATGMSTQTTTTTETNTQTITATDDMNQLIIIGSVIGGVFVIAVVAGLIIWGSSSATSSAAMAAPAFQSSPATVFRRPAVHPRFVPSQTYSSSYRGCYNNGYYDNQRCAYRAKPRYFQWNSNNKNCQCNHVPQYYRQY